jgi:hypothetical protein
MRVKTAEEKSHEATGVRGDRRSRVSHGGIQRAAKLRHVCNERKMEPDAFPLV